VSLQESKKKISRIMDGRGLRIDPGLQNSANLVKLDSCFGGMAIYRYFQPVDKRWWFTISNVSLLVRFVFE